jgi:hypothetical protein
MSELNPRSAKVGDQYRTALGLRLLPVGSVIRNGPRVRPCHFRKVDIDAWVYDDAPADTRSGLGTRALPFRSEQIWLPAALTQLDAPGAVSKSEPTQTKIDAARLLLERAGYTVLKVPSAALPWWARGSVGACS